MFAIPEDKTIAKFDINPLFGATIENFRKLGFKVFRKKLAWINFEYWNEIGEQMINHSLRPLVGFRCERQIVLPSVVVCCLIALFAAQGLAVSPAGYDDDDDIRFQTVSRLTLSFAPEGTEISRYGNSLFSSFQNEFTDEQIKAAVLEAFQTWARHSAINVGLVEDSGDAFGIGGMSQGDPRFGDIRVGAVPMAGDVFAVAVPSADFISGTWSGDLLFNSNVQFESYEQFFAVALHEAGHVLGLGHTEDETSVMHPTALNTELNEADVAEIKSLYGDRVELDPHDYDDDGDNNDTFKDATRIEDENEDDGIGNVPLLVFGDIENVTEIDIFEIRPEDLDEYTGELWFRVISNSLSFLRPKLSVFKEDHNDQIEFVDCVTSNSSVGSDIEISINVSPQCRYFIKIEAEGSQQTQFGSYALIASTQVAHDQMEQFEESIQTALRGNYSHVDEDDLQDLVATGFTHEILDDLHSNDTLATATELLPPLNVSLHSAYREQASIADATDVDFYFFDALDSVASVRVSAMAEQAGLLIPKVTLYDNQQNEIPGQPKVNGNGELLIEYTGLMTEQLYYLSVAANDATGDFNVGNYDLNIAFKNTPRELDLLAPTRRQFRLQRNSSIHTLYVARSQLFHFAFENIAKQPTKGEDRPTFWISIYDEAGTLKYRCATRASEFRTCRSVLLIPGSYSVRIQTTIAGPAWSTNAAILNRYRLWGVGVSEPTGPELIDPADDPFAPCDKAGSDFCYPNDRFSPDEFIFVDQDEVDIPPVAGPVWIDADDWYWGNGGIG